VSRLKAEGFGESEAVERGGCETLVERAGTTGESRGDG
jgi:hypothetical protein